MRLIRELVNMYLTPNSFKIFKVHKKINSEKTIKISRFDLIQLMSTLPLYFTSAYVYQVHFQL